MVRTLSHGLEYLRIAKVINTSSLSSVTALRLQGPVPAACLSIRVHNDGSLAFGVGDENWRATDAAERTSKHDT